ncbi:MAG: hypothetical protein N4J56_000395 [Chroococcidiopsis sp. SAG 2025]|uniref:hypothetical protein n=1 Tax=Chroococcidiopsis sp. SAG 2025 TaxID=171389 RepID=UPI002936EC41|nr:hypothetical protein [Chroococcidiopsis sp. SAG 2025]MDV2990741.1 hypothetical protein [Chroococcidiopsis sp. SAG 2025]
MNTNTTNPAAIASNKNSFPSRDINERIRQRDHLIIENALAQGCDYWQMSKAMPKDTFKAWLESQGKTLTEAKKFIRLFETFRDFAIEKIERISLTTLFALTQKRYQQLVSRLWGLPATNENQVAELMAEARKQQQQDSTPTRDVRGLVNLPSGGRAFQFPLLHDDETIARLLQVLQD